VKEICSTAKSGFYLDEPSIFAGKKAGGRRHFKLHLKFHISLLAQKVMTREVELMPKNASLKKSAAKKIPVSNKPFWIGFDLGGTKMMACVLDENYKVLGSARKSTQGSFGAAKGIKRIIATVKEAIEMAHVNPAKIKGFGIGCPGTVDTAQGVLITAPNLGWHRIQLGNALKKEFKCPVAILNDVDSGTYGEYRHGAGKGARSLLGVFPGTGLGAGFVYDGRLVHGRNVSCMELGMLWLPGTHLSSTVDGAVLLEDLTSRLGIASAASVECYRGKAKQLDAKTNAALREMKSKALGASYKAEEEAIVRIFDNSVRYLGLGIALVVNLMAPDHITLGGGLVEELPQYYIKKLKEQIQRYAIPEIFKGTTFSIAKLGGNAVAVGALSWLRDNR
jgi:glucokinase